MTKSHVLDNCFVRYKRWESRDKRKIKIKYINYFSINDALFLVCRRAAIFVPTTDFEKE